ncbi:gamma-glutamylcyclotransferase [Hylemonella gracilis]|uniref:glutathione-specific gamma-glutamylcyclotransferase n=1 Tax=Hylemonella gracilis TaxID=80880 RepID=A0A4P6UQH3_9BURK|nr:gamma-glutamylcyclotransferase [Hylemonella gracilis]QBK06435.1 gamma-glutamylcyclotransferase [Hylemonella gracilis]
MNATRPRPLRDPAPMLAHALREWQEHHPEHGAHHGDFWLFGYGSLIWRPDFDHTERRMARVRGWHRALKMWSRINRGTVEQPGLVFALLSGGSCHGVVYRIARAQAPATLAQLWQREMATGVYDPRWLRCDTPQGPVRALAFTLSRRSPNYTGTLSAGQYEHIFRHAHGIYGSTRDYARQTLDSLRAHGIHDQALEALLKHAP